MTEAIEVSTALENERVDRVLALLSGRSRSEVTALIRSGAVRIDGETVLVGHRRVHGGQLLALDALPGGSADVGLRPADEGSVPFRVVHEDASIIIVDKPAGVVVHPGAGHRDDTLASGLIVAFPDLVGAAAAGAGEPMRPGIVHRLDKDTSGLLVVARTAAAYRHLADQISTRSMGRSYVALALGRVEATDGIIDAPIGRSTRDPTRMSVRASGREARTRYHVEERFTDPLASSLLEVALESGRTHQIRVHLRAIGHPVAGDRKYGGGAPALGLRRPFLHAAALRLVHPASGKECEWRAPLPEELVSVLEHLE